jgi:hypothetical protein
MLNNMLSCNLTPDYCFRVRCMDRPEPSVVAIQRCSMFDKSREGSHVHINAAVTCVHGSPSNDETYRVAQRSCVRRTIDPSALIEPSRTLETLWRTLRRPMRRGVSASQACDMEDKVVRKWIDPIMTDWREKNDNLTRI